MPPRSAILRASLAAASANLVPGLILQAVMVAVLVGYWTSPPVRDFLAHLAALKSDTGFLFAIFAAGFAGGVLPEILRVCVFQRFRPTRTNLHDLIFGAIFWGAMGLLIDVFYRFQAILFGSDPTPSVVTAKVLFDMLVFTPAIGVPIAATAYLWKSHRFDPAIFGDVLNLKGYRTHILPVLIPNWAVWGPVVCVIYALPSDLQIPVYVLAEAFWVLILTTLTAKAPAP